MLGISVLVFSLTRLAPGGPIVANLGTLAGTDPEMVEKLIERLGLDQPIYVQYFRWLSHILRGDLGNSFIGGEGKSGIAGGGGIPVAYMIWRRLPVTAELTFFGMILIILIAIPAGIIGAYKSNTKVDHVTRVFNLFGISTPEYWLGILLIMVFSLYFRVLPTGGYVSPQEDLIENLRHMLLPSLALGLVNSAIVARVLRSSMLEVFNQDYIRTARSKGLTERIVIFRHALKNSMIPTITILGMQVAYLLGGAVLIEQTFFMPGIGQLLMNSMLNRDYPAIQAVVLLTATIVVIANLIVDLFYAYLDPRIKYG